VDRDGLLPEWRKRTYRAVLDAPGSRAGSKLISGIARKTLEDLWTHQGAPRELRPGAVVLRIYKREIEEELGKNPRRRELAPYINRLKVIVTGLRNSFQVFFDTEAGRRLPLSMSIDTTVWELTFREKDAELKRFWQLSENGDDLTIVSTAPLFLRHRKQRAFLRLLDFNREEKYERFARKPDVLPNMLGASPFVEAMLREQSDLVFRRSYVTLGEMDAVIRIKDCLRSLGISNRWCLAHDVKIKAKKHLDRAHWVLLGNVRTNPLTLRIPRRNVTIRQRPKSVLVKGETPKIDDVRPKGTAFGLITRLSRSPKGGSTLVLAANHAPAIGRLAQLVTDEKLLADLLNRYGLTGRKLPERLEFLFEFRLDSNEQVADEWCMAAYF